MPTKEKKRDFKDVVQTTNDGKMFVKNRDLFQQKEVKVIVKELKESAIVKAIQNKKAFLVS